MTIKVQNLKDIDAAMRITSDGNVKMLYGTEVLRQSIRTIILTVSGERVRSSLGSTVIRILFKPVNNNNARQLSKEIKRVVERFEPRVENVSVDVYVSKERKNTYDVIVVATAIGNQEEITYQTRLNALGVA